MNRLVTDHQNETINTLEKMRYELHEQYWLTEDKDVAERVFKEIQVLDGVINKFKAECLSYHLRFLKNKSN